MSSTIPTMTACRCGAAQRCAQCSGCPNCCSCGTAQSEDEVRRRRGTPMVRRRRRGGGYAPCPAGTVRDAHGACIAVPLPFVDGLPLPSDGLPLPSDGFIPTPVEN